MGQIEGVPAADRHEANYVAALSRPSVVAAYADWSDLTAAEKLCFDNFLEPGGRILDLGCGAGRFLAGAGDGWRSYVGVDSSEGMIEAAKARFPEADFRLGDILEFEAVPQSFDAVLLLRNVIDMLHPAERRGAVLNLARRVLSPGGVLICSTHLTHERQSVGYFEEEYHGAAVLNYRCSVSEWCAELERAGFDPLLVCANELGSGVADWVYAVSRPRAA